MQNQRQTRVGELLRRSIAECLNRGHFYHPQLSGTHISVTEVKISPDLRHAHIYVALAKNKDAKEILAALEKLRVKIQHQVLSEVKMKFAPKFTFRHDTSLDQAEAIENLFTSPKVIKDLES